MLEAPFVAFALFLPTGGFLLILARFLTSQKDIRLSKWIISEKWIRYGFFICLTSVGVLVAFSFNGLSLLFQILDTVHERLFFPFGDDRIMRNVAELHPMYFINWWDRFGIFLFPSLAGVSLLFSQLLGQLGLSSRLVMPAFGGFMVTTFLSTLSPSSSWFNGRGTTAQQLFLAGLLAFVLSLVISFLRRKKDKVVDLTSQKLNRNLFVCIWFLITFILTHSARRFDALLSPVFLIAGCFCLVQIGRWVFPEEKRASAFFTLAMALLCWQLLATGLFTSLFQLLLPWNISVKILLPLSYFLIAVSVFVLLGGYIRFVKSRDGRPNWIKFITGLGLALLTLISLGGTPVSLGFAAESAHRLNQIPPYVPNQDWRKATAWMRAELPPGQVIAAWWDYGSWINELGRQATIVDEEQQLYWIHLLARHVFCAQSQQEASEFLKTHTATHLLLTERELKNFWAVSEIGSDSHFDRREKIGVLISKPLLYLPRQAINTSSRIPMPLMKIGNNPTMTTRGQRNKK